MAEAELNSQASALAAQLLHIGTLLGQVESSAAILEHLDDGFWTRIKAAVEMQTLQSHLDDPMSSDTAWSGAMQRWIWPELNARCPPPTLRLEPAQSFNETGKRTGFDDLLDSGSFPSLVGPSPSSLPPAPPRPPSPPFDSPMFNATSAPESYTFSNTYSDPYPETYFPPISVPPTASPFFDAAPFASSTINPQLLFQSPPATDSMTPRLPSIFTSFVAAPFPNGSDILVTTAHGAFDEATTPVSASKLFGSQSMFDHLAPANGYGDSSSSMVDEYSISGKGGQGMFSGSFDFRPHDHSPTPPEGLGANLSQAISSIPSSVTIAISRSETPPSVEHRPSHGRSRSFGSAGSAPGGSSRHRHSFSGTNIRVEPYPTSATDVEDVEDATVSLRTRHRRGSSASRHPPDLATGDYPAKPSANSLGTKERKKVSGSSHRRSPSNQSIGDLGSDFGLAKSEEPSPSTGLEQLRLSPGLPPLFPTFPIRRVKSDAGVVKRREKRKLVISPDAVFRDNEADVFVVYAPSKEGKVSITPNDIQEVVLDPTSNRVGSYLWEVAFNHREYSAELHERDCENVTSYLFNSTSVKRPVRYHVTFSHAHPEGFVQTVDPNDDVTLHQPRLPMTFIHFLPNTIVVFPTHVIGSAMWWRLPRCKGRHLKGDEDDGSWTGRWDREDPRRPSRLVEHFAECEHRKGLGARDGLGQLARAIRAPLAGSNKSRPRRISKSNSRDEDEDEDEGDEDGDDAADAIDAYRRSIHIPARGVV